MHEEKTENNHRLNSIDWNRFLEELESFTSCELTKEKIRDIQPLPHQNEALQSFDRIKNCIELLNHQPRLHFLSLDASISWLTHLNKEAILKILDLKDLRSFLLETLSLEEFLNHEVSEKTPFADYVLPHLIEALPLLSAINQILTEDGEIKTDASENLFKLYQEKKKLTSEMQGELNSLVKTYKMEPILQDRFVTTREGRWVIPVKSGMQHAIEGIIHDNSQSRQTVFMEPETVVPINNRLRKIEIEIKEEIEKLLRELSYFLHPFYQDLKQTQKFLIESDFIFCQAKITQVLKAKPCQFGETIQLQDLKNPLLLLQEEKVRANDVELDKKKPILILSGPNAGGKTVLLKSIGLAAHMARCGFPICASPDSTLPFYSQIHISVGDHQSVDQNLSTFAAHLVDLNQALQNMNSNKSGKTLLLIDEICGSTDPEEGGALARSFIEHYAELGIFAIITSHLGILKLNWPEESGVVSGSLEYDTQSGRPTYRFIYGISGESQALQTAKRLGVEPQIIDRAVHLLSQEGRERLRQQDSVEELKTQLAKLQEDCRRKLGELQHEKSKYEKLNRKLENESQKLIEENVNEAKSTLDEMVKNVRVDQIFKNNAKIQEAKNHFPKVIKKTNSNNEVLSAEDFERKYPPGSSVYVPSLKQKAVVQSTPNQKGEVSIQSQSMRLLVPWIELIESGPTNDSIRTPHRSFRKKGLSLETPHSVDIDLRGQKVEAAIENLEKHLDDKMKASTDQFKVIHGHGTDALKRAVRSHLSRSMYVTSWQAGSQSSGGDGVTWVKLNVE